MKAMRTLALGALLALGACSSDGAPAQPSPTPDAGPVATGVPLLEWVTEMTSQTADDAIPDTVEDKVVVDTDDPAAFDSFLPQG
jgi:hypothetical protein